MTRCPVCGHIGHNGILVCGRGGCADCNEAAIERQRDLYRRGFSRVGSGTNTYGGTVNSFAVVGQSTTIHVGPATVPPHSDPSILISSDLPADELETDTPLVTDVPEFASAEEAQAWLDEITDKLEGE